MNKVFISGHIGTVSDLGSTKNGIHYRFVSMADKIFTGGENQTQWIRLKIYKTQAEKFWGNKGDFIAVVGRLKLSDAYTDKNGKAHNGLYIEVESFEISAKGERQEQTHDKPKHSGTVEAMKSFSENKLELDDDDVPF